jgi:hypothetical protein
MAALVVTLACAAGATAQKSGALVGVVDIPAGSLDAQDFESVHPPKFKTLWIAPDGSGKLQILTTIPELIVPRKDGFWHAGVEQVCEFDQTIPDEGGNESLNQVIWAAPVGTAGVIVTGQACPRRKAEDYVPRRITEEDNKKVTQCGFTLTDIEFASPAVVSYRNFYTQSEDCEERGGRLSINRYVRGYDSDEKLSFARLLGPQAGQAYVKAAPAEAHDDNGEDCGEPSTNTDTDWRIGRNKGRWSAFFSQNVGNFGCAVDAPVRFRLPASVTGETTAITDWKPYQAKEADLQDGFISPTGDIAVIVTKTEIKFYEVQAGAPERVLLTMPAASVLVVQWSTGTHVSDWTAQMEKIAKLPVLPPTRHVKKDVQ